MDDYQTFSIKFFTTMKNIISVLKCLDMFLKFINDDPLIEAKYNTIHKINK